MSDLVVGSSNVMLGYQAGSVVCSGSENVPLNYSYPALVTFVMPDDKSDFSISAAKDKLGIIGRQIEEARISCRGKRDF